MKSFSVCLRAAFLPPIGLLALLCSIAACDNYGTKKTFGGVDLYYKSPVTESEADTLGKYLIANEFAKDVKTADEQKSVQIEKEGNTYLFRMVAKEDGEKDEAIVPVMKQFIVQLSRDVFPGSEVTITLCDKYFKPLRTVSLTAADKKSMNGNAWGEMQTFNATDVYHHPSVSASEANELGNYLVKSGFADGDAKSVQIRRKDGTYQFRMVADMAQVNDETMPAFIQFRRELSDDVFDSNPVEIHLCNNKFETLKVIDASTEM
jgi:hypothetical protein